uniref:Uncharacterized protein n=1 Tax=Brassica campestris TaxID=3711 RepID=A0A3P6BEH6_BRACM|nr:unnamed protein product [Brassica rapa]
MELLVVVRKKKDFVTALVNMPWEGKLIALFLNMTKLWPGRTISQPEFWVDLLQCHHQLRVLRLHPHLSPQFPSQEVSFRKKIITKSQVT